MTIICISKNDRLILKVHYLLQGPSGLPGVPGSKGEKGAPGFAETIPGLPGIIITPFSQLSENYQNQNRHG